MESLGTRLEIGHGPLVSAACICSDSLASHMIELLSFQMLRCSYTVGKKSLRDLRQLYFLLKNRIFMKSRHGYGYSSDVLEEILKEYLNPELKMSDETHPK